MGRRGIAYGNWILRSRKRGMGEGKAMVGSGADREIGVPGARRAALKNSGGRPPQSTVHGHPSRTMSAPSERSFCSIAS